MANRMSRPKPPPPGNEEASATLNLGEFQNVDTLTLSEAALVLNALVAKRRNDRKNVNETEYVRPALVFNSSVSPGRRADGQRRLDADCCLHRMLNQTLNYLDHFARFTQKENVEAVERLLSSHKALSKFERAQLGMPAACSPATSLHHVSDI